jgi:hypothetical protein
MQTLPITKYANDGEVLSTLLSADPMWHELEILSLKTNMRAIGLEQQSFREWALRVGMGEEPTHEGSDLVKLPDQVVVPEEQSLINEVFGVGQIPVGLMETENRVIMCPTNADALDLNNEIVLNRCPNRLHTIASVDSLIVENEAELAQAEQFPIEAVHQMTPTGLPPHILNIRVGSVVMLLVNIDTTQGLCNGTRLIVREVRPHVLDLEVLSGPHRGNRCLLTKFKMQERESEAGFKIQRIQFPIRLAYSITINKVSYNSCYSKKNMLKICIFKK